MSVNRYANELRYALVYSVFVEPIEVQTYTLPFTFRHPRLMKPAEYRITPFNIQLQKLLRKNDLLQKLKKVEKNKKGSVKCKFLFSLKNIAKTKTNCMIFMLQLKFTKYLQPLHLLWTTKCNWNAIVYLFYH